MEMFANGCQLENWIEQTAMIAYKEYISIHNDNPYSWDELSKKEKYAWFMVVRAVLTNLPTGGK